MDVMRAALSVAEYYGIEAELVAAIQSSVDGAVRSGELTQQEAREPIYGRN